MAKMSWEGFIRNITLVSEPDKVAELAVVWRDLGIMIDHLQDALTGETNTPSGSPTMGLTGALASWTGKGADAYRERVGKLAGEVTKMSGDATDVGKALELLSKNIVDGINGIPIPLRDDAGYHEYSLPNDTNLDGADDGADRGGLLSSLLSDYAKDPSSYEDGAFKRIADDIDLEYSMKPGEKNHSNARGGVWDTQGHIANWYNDNLGYCTSGNAVKLPGAMDAERPRIYVELQPGATDLKVDDRTPIGTTPPGTTPPGSTPPGVKPPNFDSKPPNFDSKPPNFDSKPPGYDTKPPGFDTKPPGFDPKYPDSTLPPGGRPGDYTPEYPGGYKPGDPGGFTPSPYPEWDGPNPENTGLAGANPNTGLSSTSGYGGGGGVGSGTGAFGSGGAGGGVPGAVGGGAGGPVLSSPGKYAADMRGGAAGMGMGMMGGGMGAGGHGGPEGGEQATWLREDEDPWGADNDNLSGGVLK
ncbi:hypothetical protein [Longispora albida]|uniref:hypothetical protein n=1 Tax=Longispora albida TaxID=203523 RepID=UPI0003A50663|nr:hypothetical protein [Longispora albida]